MIRLRIKELAEKQHLTQSRLAELSDVTPQLINGYWNNHAQRVSLKHLARIAKALGVKPGELITEDEAERAA